jgi:hypothetical protein
MNGLSERQLAAYLLILCSFVFLVAGFLFTARAIWNWPVGQTAVYLRWERGVVIAAFLISLLGFGLVEKMLSAAGDIGIARMALLIYLISAGVMVVAETNYLNGQWSYPQIVAHVVLAFLAQAAFGLALLQTGLLPGWVAWASILWNLGCLVILPILMPQDMYFPWLHYVAPLLIGISLLRT